MDTNQQPKAAYLAQELKAGTWSPNILQNEVALRQCAADELRRLHAENEALSNKLQTFEALGCAVDDLQLLRMGYASARLEIASLKVRAADARHDIDDLTARDESQRLRIAELEAQLAAIGAGGVEPLRKRECLHHVAEQAQIDSDAQRDAERYRWLRKQHWNEGVLCVVAQPKKSVKLGRDCPSLDRLDCFIDAARSAQGGV